MITLQNEVNDNETKALRFFLDKTAAGFYEWEDWTIEKGLERMVFRVAKTPDYLQGHLERIYYCFHNHMDLHLFGALVDLLIVLGDKGYALCERMILGCKSRLTEDQFKALMDHHITKSLSQDLLPLTRYSVFSNGTVSTAKLLKTNY